MLIVTVLLATVLLRVGLVAGLVYLLLPRGPGCPRCGEVTAAVRHALLDRALGLLQERLCIGCGWSGVMRGTRGAAPAAHRGVMSRTARS